MNPRVLMTAREVMQQSVITVAPDQPVVDAVQVLLHKNISGAPVVADGKLVGMFSERDCLGVLASAAYDAEPEGTVAQHMRRQVLVVQPDSDIFRLASLFQNHAIRRLPVVDADGRLLGVVLRGDVIRALEKLRPTREQYKVKTSYEQIEENKLRVQITESQLRG